MSNFCYPILRGRRLRATRLDGCGTPVLGPDSTVVTKGFISVALTANNEEGEEINVTNANGEVCVLDTPVPKLKNYSVEITFCDVNPALLNLMSGQPLVLNGTDTVGFRVNSDVDTAASGFGLELWTGVASETCEVGSGTAYGYLLLPFLQGGTLGDFTVENAAINFTLTGATTKKGSGWGVGPYDVVMDSGTPGPLATAINSGDHLHLERTTVAPPEADCDPQPLGVEATGFTAGTPGTSTPANSYPPASAAELIAEGPLLPPATPAWTTGQYIVLRDGSTAYWDGDQWVAGIA
jgi:hypothetical protein